MNGFVFKLSLIVFLFATTGCRLQVNVLGNGSVLVTEDQSTNVIMDCADRCTHYSPTALTHVDFAATPLAGSTFITYIMDNNVIPVASDESYYYGLYFSPLSGGYSYINLDVQAIFHETADLAEVQTSSSIACLLSYSEGLSCWGSADDGTQESIDDIPDEFRYADEFEVSFQNVCVLADQKVGCWGSNTALADVPPLINPLNLRFENQLVCVDDNSGKVCWGD